MLSLIDIVSVDSKEHEEFTICDFQVFSKFLEQLIDRKNAIFQKNSNFGQLRSLGKLTRCAEFE